MNASIRSVPIHPRLAARPALGMPTAVVVVSALVVANVSVLAGSSAWPTVRATHASAAAPSTKARVIKINRRLKGDHLALPGASQQVLERWDSQQHKNHARPENDEPHILAPSGQPVPIDDDPTMIDCEPVVAAQAESSGVLAGQCITAIAAYRKAAEMARRSNTPQADGDRVWRHSKYA